MRKLVWTVGLLFGMGLHAATTLEFDMVITTTVRNKDKKVSISKLNKDLKKKNLDGIPAKIVVGESAEPYWKLLMGRIADAEKALKKDYDAIIDKKDLHEYPAICYRGEASDVPAILTAMTGNFLVVEYLGVRYGKETVVPEDGVFESDDADEIKLEFGGERDEEVDQWFNYRTGSKTVLVMTNLGAQGDGTDLYVTKIKPCKDNEDE